MPDVPSYFNNIIIGQFVLTGVPVKVYVDGVYLTITDPDDIEDPYYGFGIDDDGAVHNFDYRMIDHLLVANQHLDIETYKKAMTPATPAAENPKQEPKEEPKEEPKKEESIMKLKSLIKNNVREDVSADKKKLVDLKKKKTELAQDIATLTLSIADDEAEAAKAGVTENNVTDLSEPYTIQVGDMVQNINPDCMHYGSVGIVQNVTNMPDDSGTLVKYVVTNNGDTFSAGDGLVKTADQLQPYGDDEEMYDDDSEEMDDWEVTNMDGLDDDEDYEDYDDDEDYEDYDDDDDLDESLSENINDPVLVALRASQEARKKSAAAQAAMMKKRVYGRQREKLENDLMDIAQELKDLYSDKRSVLSDMEAEAGEKGNDWTDDDADRYGDKLNKIDDSIEALLQKRQKLEIKLAY